MTPKRVLFLSPVGEKGGAETVLLDMVRTLDRTRFAPLAVCLKPGPLVDELKALEVPVFTFRAHKTRELHQVAMAVGGLARLIRREKIELVHGNGCTMLFYGGLAGMLAGKCLCVWHVYDPLRGNGLFERAFVAAQRLLHPAWTIFGTPAVGQSYLETYSNARPNSTILPGISVDWLRSDTDSGTARQNLGIPEGVAIVSMFARLQRNKGHFTLLDAAELILQTHPNTHFVLCGGALFGLEPDYPKQLREAIRRRGLCEHVTLTGFVSDQDKRNILAASSIVVHPALSEPFGLAILEGMAAGKPVVATDCVGPTTIVKNGETGLLVPRGRPAMLAAALIEVLDDPLEADRMGRAGQCLVETHYTLPAMMRQIEAIYEQVLGATPA